MPNPPALKSSHNKPTSITSKVVALFHADWCGHCQSLKPEWKKFQETIIQQKGSKPIKIVTMEESDKGKQTFIDEINKGIIGKPLEINGFPTIVKQEGGKLEYYSGKRDSESLTKWASLPIHPPKQGLLKMGARMFGGKRNRTIKRNRKNKTKKCKTCTMFKFW
jgi:thiol-disulfide isomerase/thioredoxin